MVKSSCCEKSGLRKGAWSAEEDRKLIAYVTRYGHWNWNLLPKFAGLERCGKSCRLRWLNYLRPNIKRGNYTKEEDEAIIKLLQRLGNRSECDTFPAISQYFANQKHLLLYELYEMGNCNKL